MRLQQNNAAYLNIAEYNQECLVYQYGSSQLIVHANLQIATQAHSSGMYYISGGSLIVTSMQGYCKIGVGNYADGYIINDGGYISIQRDLDLGYGDYAVGSCTLTNTSSRLNVSGDINLGSISNSNGILDVRHGEVDVGGNLSVGGEGDGTVEIDNSAKAVIGGDLSVGGSGTGELNISGTTATVLVSGKVAVGIGAGGFVDGLVSFEGGTYAVHGDTYVGISGTTGLPDLQGVAPACVPPLRWAWRGA